MFRRKKKEESVVPASEPEVRVEESAPAADAGELAAVAASVTDENAPEAASTPDLISAETPAGKPASTAKGRGNRVQKVGTVSSDKMQKTVVVRVDRLVLHPKYRRYVRRTSKFMAHDELGATTGDRVRIVETRPVSARKRWRVVEIVQKAAK
jgi:small subunit ribosomal protein S17